MISARTTTITLLATVTVLVAVSPARSFQYDQVYSQGFATDQEVAQSLGRLSFSMTDCRHVGLGQALRSVRVVSERANYESRPVIEMTLRRAVEFAWRSCPLHFIFAGSETPAFQLDVTSVELYLPNGALALRASGFTGDQTFNPGSSYGWKSVEDIGAQQRAQAAAAAVQRVQEAQRQVVIQQRRVEVQAREDHFWASVQQVVLFVGLAAVALWLFACREAILRWYFFAFHPHPAAPLVQSALDRGDMLDGKALARALAEVPPGSRILREVRIEQGERLVAQMKVVSERMIKEGAARAAADYERAAFVGIQEAVALAAVAVERAKAAQQASRSVRGGAT